MGIVCYSVDVSGHKMTHIIIFYVMCEMQHSNDFKIIEHCMKITLSQDVFILQLARQYDRRIQLCFI